MADRIITAEAIITAKDATGDAFTRIAAKFQQIGKGAKVSADVARMVKTLEQADSQLRALDKLQSTRSSFTDARAKFNAQKVAVEQASKAMRDAERPTKALETAYNSAQRAVSKASAEFERSKTAMLDAKHAAEAFGTPLAKVAADQARLKGVIDSTTRSIEHQANAELHAATAHAKAEKAAERRAEGIRHHGIVRYAAGTAAGYVGAHSIVTGIEKTLHAGAEYQHELVGLRNAGRSDEEIKAVQDRSAEVAHKLPTATYTENMKVVAETTQAFGSVEHAMEHLEFMQRSMSVLKAAGGEHIKGTVGDVGRDLAKTFEQRFTKPEDFEKEAAAMIPAMVASGGTFNPRELYAFAQQAKGSLPNYSMRFLSGVAPSIIGGMGGDRAGTAANAFSSVIMGKANDKKQAEAWMQYGLLDPKKTIMKAGHAVSWSAGAVKGSELALSDPLRWAEEVALPAMQAKGVKTDDRMALSLALGTLFRNQNSNQFANEIMQHDSRARLHKDEALFQHTGSLNSIYDRNLKSDPGVGLQAFNASLENLMATVSGPAMGAISAGLSGLASGIGTLADALKDHPVLAMTAGGVAAAGGLAAAGALSYSIANGFGLGASATALDASAAMLSEAAVALGAKGIMQEVPGGGFRPEGGRGVPGEVPPESALPKGKPGILGAGGAKGLAGGLASGLVGWALMEGGTRGMDWIFNRLPHPAYPKGYNPDAILDSGVSGSFERLLRSVDARTVTPRDPWLGGDRPAIERRSALAADAFKRDPEAARGAAFGRIGSDGPVDVTGKVQADVHTDVEVRFKLDVPPGFGVTKEFQSVVSRPGTGASMPGAKAASNGRVAGPN